MSPRDRDADVRETGRLEAFSDGVFAIAMTLLILEIRVPENLAAGKLLRAILDLWPSYLAFAVSFFVIGVMWMNHHRLFNLVAKSDQGLLASNLLLLFVVTFIPFPTALVARNIDTPDGRTAAIFYNAVFFAAAIAFHLLWRHASGNHGALLAADADPASVAAITRHYRFGPALYLVLTLIAYFTAVGSLLLNLATAAFFAIPSRRFRPRAEG